MGKYFLRRKLSTGIFKDGQYKCGRDDELLRSAAIRHSIPHPGLKLAPFPHLHIPSLIHLAPPTLPPLLLLLLPLLLFP